GRCTMLLPTRSSRLSLAVFSSLCVLAFSGLGCAAGGADLAADEAGSMSSADLSAASTFHGTVSINLTDALDPDSRLHTPFAWDIGRQVVLVLPATLDPEHPVHSWDVEVTEDETKLDLLAEAIKTFANGKPDLRGSNVRSEYGVRDVDTIMTLYK